MTWGQVSLLSSVFFTVKIKMILSYQLVSPEELTSLVMDTKAPEDQTNETGKEGLREGKREEGNLPIRGALASST